MKLILACLFLYSLMPISTMAAVPKSPIVAKEPKNILQKNGALRGGRSAGVYSLLDIRSSTSKNKKIERIVLDIGNASMQKSRGLIGYYNVELKNGNKVLIDLPQTLNSKVEPQHLGKKLIKSAFIKNSQLLFDPITQNTSLVFDLKKYAKVRVLSVRGGKQTGKLVVDLIEDTQR